MKDSVKFNAKNCSNIYTIPIFNSQSACILVMKVH